jgi:GGDEF domain-containing protein
LIAVGMIALAAPLAYEPGTSLLVAEIVLQGSFTFLLAFVTWAIVGAARQMRLGLGAEARVDDLTGLGNRRAFDE